MRGARYSRRVNFHQTVTLTIMNFSPAQNYTADLVAMSLSQNSLVLYKNRPARVRGVGDKLELELAGGRFLKVRPKDVVLLHPGPIHSLDDLHPPDGDVKTAWELLAGESTTLPELAELIYQAYTPSTAWAVWQLVEEGLYFRGSPEAVVAATPDELAEAQAARQAKIREAEAWAEFLARAGEGRMAPEDAVFLREVESLAFGRQSKSRVLRELGRTQTPENAHALLLELGYWDHTVNPYPHRLKLPVEAPTVDLPDLPAESRVDLTHLPAFAIDDEGSQDPDDALSLDAGRRLWVHVADVAALVSPGSPADIEAQARGAKLYLPEIRVPMLPPRANDILALGLSEVSPALSFCLESAGDDAVSVVEIVPSWVRVTRLTYEEAEARLEEPPFQDLYRLARQHQARRQANGAVSIDLPEVKVRVEEGRVAIRPVLPLRSRTLVREAMLMAGQAAARFALNNQIPLPFTTQDRISIPDGLPEGMAGMFALRRLMTRSQLSTVPGPHGGLGLNLYTQMTSPLRRYLDLVIHQQLRAFLLGRPLLDAPAILERVGAAESLAGSLRHVERLSNRHWTLVYLMQHPGWQGRGVVVDRQDSRYTLLIPELDWQTTLHLRRELPLNSELLLAVTGIHLAGQEAYFQVKD